MKKILILFILFFNFSNYAIGANENLQGLNNLGDSQLGQLSQIQEDLNKNVNNIEVGKKNGLIQVFCDKYHISKEGERKYTTVQENNKIIETYLNNYGSHIIELSGLSSKIISDEKTWVITTKSQIDGNNKKEDNPFFGKSPKETLNLAEKECLQFRADKPTNSEEIDHIYEQVRFYSEYYKSYHDDLTKGIIPGFIIGLIEGINISIFYLIIISIGNIIYRVVIFSTGKGKDYSENQTKLFNSIWYFLLIFLIKIGIIGSIMTFVGFDGLNLIKTLFFY